MTPSQLKLILEDKIKTHERAIDNVPWSQQKSQITAAIRAYEKVLEMIDGPTPE